MPLTVVPSCFTPLLSVASGSPCCQAPLVAVSVADGFVVQPSAVSNVSSNTVVVGAPVTANTRSSWSMYPPVAQADALPW